MLLSFDLDVNQGKIVLTFSETVSLESLDVTELRLLNSETNHTQSLYLTSNSTTNDSDWTMFTIALSAMDLNLLKRLDELAISNTTTFINLTEFFVRDNAGNMNLPTLNATQVLEFTADETDPRLVSFDLDLSLDTLTFRFSETVDASSLDPTQLTLLSGSLTDALMDNSSNTTADYFTNYTLTGGENTPLRVDSTELVLKLSFDDRNEIRKLTDLAVSNSSTFVAITDGFVLDMNGNMVEAIEDDSPLPVSSFTSDSVRPWLTSFDLDMDGPLLTLFFSETVRVSTLNISGISLQSSEVFASGSTQSHQLADVLGTRSASENSPRVEIEVGELDANEIKYLTDLAQDKNSTFLTVAAFTFEDMYGNPVVSISDANATEVDEYFPDVTGPLLRNFTLNLTSERLILTFDETVDFLTVSPLRVTLQDSMLSGGVSYTLNRAVPIGDNSHIVELNLTASQRDLNEIKLQTGLATEEGDTFIYLAGNAISDLALKANPILPTTIGVQEYFPDLITPELLSFSVDVNASTLTLVFDEVVNTSSLDPTAIRFQNASTYTESHINLSGIIYLCVYTCTCTCV